MQNIQPDSLSLSALKPELDEAADALEAGNLTQASLAVKSLLTKAPYEYRVLQLAATVALARNQAAVAVDYFRRALSVSRAPLDAARTLHGLGLALRDLNDLEGACDAFQRAGQANKGNLVSALEHAKTLGLLATSEIVNAAEKRAQAEQVLRDIMGRFPDDPRPPTELGITRLNGGHVEDALKLFESVLEKCPDFPPAVFNRGVALTMLGKSDEARIALEHSLTVDRTIEGYYHMANLHRFSAGDPWFTRLQQRSKEPLSQNARIDIEFALAKACEDIEDYDQAFDHLETANREKRRTIQYDLRGDEARVEQIIAISTPDFFARFSGRVSSDVSPIFILGMPRSGSTLLEQMLAAHPKISAGGELPYMLGVARAIGAAWESRKEKFLSIDAEVIADLQNGADTYARLSAHVPGDKPRFTDKLPGNFQFIGLIHLMFPQATIINCRRDPVDTCLSCYKKHFQSAVPYSFDLGELGRYYTLYERLMKHWHRVLPGRILDVDYESLVANPETELRRVLEFCNLEFDPACLEFHKVERPVKTASVLQVRKPLYKDSIRRWKKYESRLGPLLDALGINR
ncbi:MAG TPA: sulfotransferase [Gammaproteobacteria bacterium]|nr:sulfotransferase [Gammaproteobacteria bacterium]